MIKFASHTAHLISWIPEGQEEVLYLSPKAHMETGKAIRGGVPVCWPWFGNKKGEPSHGFARLQPWKKKTENKFELFANEAKLTLEVEEEGNTLTLKLTTKNTTFKTFEFTQALHTYFKIGDINQISVKGHDQDHYYDKVLDDNGVQEGTLIFNGETDRIYQTTKPSILIDPVMKRTITVSKEGSNSTVIWNPGAKKTEEIQDLPDDGFENFCCIEAANTHLDPISLRADESWVLVQRIVLSGES